MPRFTDSSLEGRSQLIPQVAMCQPPKRQSAGQAIIDLTSDTEDSPQARDMQAGLEDVPELDTPAYKNEKSEGKPLTISHRQHFEVLSTSGQHKVTFSEAIGIKDLPKSEPYQKPVGIVPHLQSIHSRGVCHSNTRIQPRTCSKTFLGPSTRKFNIQARKIFVKTKCAV